MDIELKAANLAPLDIDAPPERSAPVEIGGRLRALRKERGWTLEQTSQHAGISLSADLAHKKMLPFRTRVIARKPTEYSEWARHSGETFVYVLSGTLVVYSELYQPLILQAGESMYYDASTGHKWVSDGPEDAEVMWVYAG